jgi:uncharacterized membrane protein
MKKGKTTLLKLGILFSGAFVLLLCIFWLPSEARYAAETNPEYAYLQYPVLIGLYLTAIPFYFGKYQTLKLLRDIEKNEAFSIRTVDSLKQVKYCAFIVMFLYIIGMVFLFSQNALHPGIAIIGLPITLASMFIALFAAILQELLSHVVKMKTEHDLTV